MKTNAENIALIVFMNIFFQSLSWPVFQKSDFAPLTKEHVSKMVRSAASATQTSKKPKKRGTGGAAAKHNQVILKNVKSNTKSSCCWLLFPRHSPEKILSQMPEKRDS